MNQLRHQDVTDSLRWRSSILAATGILSLALLLTLRPASQDLILIAIATIVATIAQFAILRTSGAPTEEREQPASMWLLNLLLLTVLHGTLWGLNMLPLMHLALGGGLLALMAAVAAWALSPYPPAAMVFSVTLLLPPIVQSALGLVDGELHQLYPVAILVCAMLYITSSLSYSLRRDANQTQHEMEELHDATRDLYLEHEQTTIQAEELMGMIMTDHLTGIANRKHLDEFLAREWRRARRSRTSLATIYLDIDNFKLFNDSEGHAAGDAALKIVAKQLKKIGQRGGDLAARYGGEEFVMVMADTNLEQASIVAERVRKSISDLNLPHPANQPYNRITVSIGLASVTPDNDHTMEQLLERADQAMYHAKKRGKNCVVQG